MLPVVDLRATIPRRSARPVDTDLLRDATHEIGFSYLVGHGVDAELTDAVVDAARAFFALPQADKDAIATIHSPHFRGYTRLGGEMTEGAVDWREQIDIDPTAPPLTPECRTSRCRRGCALPHAGSAKTRTTRLYATYGENAWKSRLRAHADVAAAHSYPTPVPRR